MLSTADRVTRTSFASHRQLTAIAATTQSVDALYAGALAADDSLESEAKVLAEEGIDAGIYRGITIS